MHLPNGFLASADLNLLYVWQRSTIEGQVIIGILLVLSIFAWAIMATKWVEMRRARRLNALFDEEFRASRRVLAIYDRRVDVEGCPMYSVYMAACAELEKRLDGGPLGRRSGRLSLKALEHIQRVIENEVARQALKLESGLIMLALAVSGSPFLGLLGTVWGVMSAFSGVARSVAAGNQADLAAMAPGVAGALLTTVAGLLVAIPSMFGYNWLVHHLRVLTVELDNFAQELVTRIEVEYLGEEDEAA